MKTNKFVRINSNITAPQVRLSFDDGGSQVVSINEARERAYRAELDLVEIVPNAKPPVCKIMDFNKWKYEEKVKRKEEQKKTKSVAPKEIRLRYCIGQHDLDTKVRALKQFLEEKRQVRLVVQFKSREMSNLVQGESVLMQMAESVSEFGTMQVKPKLEGKNLVANLMPK